MKCYKYGPRHISVAGNLHIRVSKSWVCFKSLITKSLSYIGYLTDSRYLLGLLRRLYEVLRISLFWENFLLEWRGGWSQFECASQGGQNIREKSHPNCGKSSQNNRQAKIYIRPCFETINSLQLTMFWNCLFRWKCKRISLRKK